jgi:hypothetical protein
MVDTNDIVIDIVSLHLYNLAILYRSLLNDLFHRSVY